jgi:hypothetical protein
MPNLQKIFLLFTKIVMPSTKSIVAFYVSNMQVDAPNQTLQGG